MRAMPVLVLAATLSAQQPPPQQERPQAPRTQQSAPDGTYVYEYAFIHSPEQDDYREVQLMGGFRFLAPGLGLDVRGTNALLLSDREAVRAALDRGGDSGLPRRSVEPPAPRRRLSPDEMKERVERTLRSLGSQAGPLTEHAAGRDIGEEQLDLLRYLYFEGGVVVVRDGLEVLRCERLWISPLDDRIVVEGAELRYVTPGRPDRGELVVRGPRLVKQGGRWTGRDVEVTTCTAADPHLHLEVGEVEIIERAGEFEVVVRGQSLAIGGTNILPLPDARFFTGSQDAFPIRRVGAGYSSKEGAQAEVVLGLPWNKTGGSIHEWLTGRPAQEFRGDWELGVGWIEERGVPLEGALTYGAKGVYEGRTVGFWLDDHGENIREITTNLDGSTIDDSDRGLVSTENRVNFGEDTYLDLVAFSASDPAVYSEFFGGMYRSHELPETSAYLHHGDGNHLFTIGGRWNLDNFSYRDNRSLAPSFVEELPVVTWNWNAQPIAETPWGTALVLDMETDLGERRLKNDPLSGLTAEDRTFRADQLIELSAPFALGVLNFRPFVSGRGTWYDNTVGGDSEGRIASEAGVAVGTRMSRTWSWLEDDGAHAIRHVIAPKVTYFNRFYVDDPASEFFQYDAIDGISERELVRVEVRNLVQRMEPTVGGGKAPMDFVFLDLAQDVWPDSNRDNAGETLGLFYYDFLIRPRADWLPGGSLAYAIYGDHDWKEGMRTLDTELQVGPIAGITWTADYREDRAAKGAAGLTASTQLFDRWNAFAGCQRELETDQWLAYTFGLVRRDHDWSIALTTQYDPYSDEVTFRLEFLPRLFGGNPTREERLGSGVIPVTSFATGY
jgi:hypothetical protein